MPKDDKPAATPAPEPIQGGPGGEPEQRPEPKLVAVKYGGREMQVPEDVASAWSEREREFEQRFSRQGAELGDLRKRWQSVEETTRSSTRREEPKEPDINTLWFENPQKAAELIEQRITSGIESRYRQDQALKGFWDGFYRANDDLREDEWVVQGVFRDHFDEIADLPRTKAQEKLAELTREKILRLTRKVKPASDHDRRDLLEPASGERPPRPAARDEDEGPQSISAVLSQRRAARQTARTRSA